MKLENTIQNKRKFFCQYYGQRVLVTEQEYPGDLSVVDTFFIDHVWRNDYLELREGSSLTEEELKVLDAMLPAFQGPARDRVTLFLDCIGRSETWTMGDNSAPSELLVASDHLRSIGILLPWMGLSTQDLQDYGWAKTTTK